MAMDDPLDCPLCGEDPPFENLLVAEREAHASAASLSSRAPELGFACSGGLAMLR